MGPTSRFTYPGENPSLALVESSLPASYVTNIFQNVDSQKQPQSSSIDQSSRVYDEQRVSPGAASSSESAPLMVLPERGGAPEPSVPFLERSPTPAPVDISLSPIQGPMDVDGMEESPTLGESMGVFSPEGTCEADEEGLLIPSQKRKR